MQTKKERSTPRMNLLGITGLVVWPKFAVACFGSPDIKVQISREFADFLTHRTDSL